MTFEQFYRSLLKRWYIVVVCFVCLGAGAYVGSAVLLHPVYQSTVVMQVVIRNGGNPLSSDNLTAGTAFAETEADLATTYPVLNTVAAHFPGTSVDDLSGDVQATARSNKPLFDISVKNDDPNLAAKIANDVAAVLKAQQTQLIAQPTTDGDFLVVVEPAQPSDTPVSPNKTLNAAGGVAVGLLLGMLLAVVFEMVDTRIRSKANLVSFLGWPLLATIRQTGSRESVVNLTSHNINSEGFSILHTNIGFSAVDKPARTMVVTSTVPGEGKSVVAANLAISMAKAGKNTLLIDANLRHPTIHQLFNLSSHAKGVTNAIVAFRTASSANGQQVLMPLIRTVNIPNLSILTSGPLPPVPSELLASNAMQNLLKALNTSGFEAVIFDTPALLGLSDATALASKVDGTIVVIDVANARKNDLEQAKAVLQQAGAHVLGTVVNKDEGGDQETPYKHVSYDSSMMSQNEAMGATPAPAWSGPNQAQASSHGVPPTPQISAHGIPPKPAQFSAPGMPPQKGSK
jgi:non-specific protein-tyrosine kinase